MQQSKQCFSGKKIDFFQRFLLKNIQYVSKCDLGVTVDSEGRYLMVDDKGVEHPLLLTPALDEGKICHCGVSNMFTLTINLTNPGSRVGSFRHWQ